MKTLTRFLMQVGLLAVLCFVFTKCSNEQLSLESDLQNNTLMSKSANSKASAQVKFNFNTHLSPDNEVSLIIRTNATGQANVKISEDETMIYYKIIVANIENVRASHFHKAPPGENGGVVVGLFLGPKKEGRFNGILAEGYITSESFSEDGENKLAMLIQDIRDGNIYINVHTDKNPPGELRGQL
ncbi:CHRD domain-containing protein [Aestuariivivens sediminicola]|uniref:CHRD domain-containing protein n=1 Tax=Aestuariivivens sediminicola TaxID=2913560 RepID=UPI001F586ED9|nr:CHRD domain-containing protein [Aestuariivivens sediminicola]